jgi:hypothetical protein
VVIQLVLASTNNDRFDLINTIAPHKKPRLGLSMFAVSGLPRDESATPQMDKLCLMMKNEAASECTELGAIKWLKTFAAGMDDEP